MQDFFQFEPDWYRQEDVRPVVDRYYYGIRCILKNRSRLRTYLKRCPHCGILFFTDPRNAGRDDVGCPFGCRQANCREKGNLRSLKFNDQKKGKDHKKKHNDRRPKKGSCADEPTQEIEDRSDAPPHEGTPHPEGPIQEYDSRKNGHVKQDIVPPDRPVQDGAPRSDKPSQEKMAQPDGSVQETGPRMREPVEEEMPQPTKSVQDAAPQSDGPSQEKGSGIGKLANEDVARPDKPAKSRVAQINESVEKKGPRDEKIPKRCEPDRDTIIYIQIIFRFVDKRWRDKDYINDLVLKMRQRSMDIHENWNYPFTRAP